MAPPRADRIRAMLQAAFPGAEVAVEDDSARHAGHPGARGGAGHFRVRVRSEMFGRRSRLERHRMVYDALAALMPAEIHALNIEAISPDDGQPSRNP